MAKTASYRAQHTQLLELAGVLAGELQLTKLKANGTPAKMAFAKLLGLLKIHLAMEDKRLYPTMLGSNNPQAAKAAKAFQDEMGSLAGTVVAYGRKWSASAISADPQTYITETRGVLAALKDRIDRENAQLYPLAEAL